MDGTATQAPARATTRAIVFDLDGVLVWSAPMHWQAFRKTFEPSGVDFSWDDYLALGLGASREEVIRRVLGDLAEHELRHLMEEKERHVREHLQARGLESIPGSLDFVRAARALSLKTAVASASRTPDLLLSSVDALPLFDAIVGRHHVVRSKPHPDLYLRAAEIIGIPPGECLVVEDSAIGIEAARAAGMRVLAITTTEPAANLARAHGVYGGFAEISLESWLA